MKPPPNLKEGIKKGKEHLWYDRHVPYFIHGHTDWHGAGGLNRDTANHNVNCFFSFLGGSLRSILVKRKERLVGCAFMFMWNRTYHNVSFFLFPFLPGGGVGGGGVIAYFWSTNRLVVLVFTRPCVENMKHTYAFFFLARRTIFNDLQC